MRAALLLTTLLLGVPVLPDSAHADPAGEASATASDLGERAAKVSELGAEVLRCTDQAGLTLALDRAIFSLDTASLAPGGVAIAVLQSTSSDGLARLRAEALADLEVAVSPVWRDAVRDVTARMWALFERGLLHPTFARATEEFTTDNIPDLRGLLADLQRPLALRTAVLTYIRGLLAACAFAAACERGEPVPDPLAALLVPQWRDSLRQLETLLATGAFAESVTEPASTPLSAVMLGFHCHEPGRLAALLESDASLAPLLGELSAQISASFPQSSVAQVALTPTNNADDDTEPPALLAAIYTGQEVADATASLERLDRDWWLDRSLRTSTRIIVDIRFV